MSQVSGVEVWSGRIRCEMKRALEMMVPQRIPHVSRFRAVLGSARLRKVVRSLGGRRTVRRGEPPSVVAVGWKVYLDAAGVGGDGGLSEGVEGRGS